MVTTYRLHVNELSLALLESIQSTFRNKTIEIIITEATDETSYLLANATNRKHILESMEEHERGEVVEFTVEELLAKYGNKQ